ncbi:MAG TPA: hypothetical protein VN442_15910 [Bryobacteraceae bacterium]|nr:hypothetical protein [Bryobacteraceae bacterium]
MSSHLRDYLPVYGTRLVASGSERLTLAARLQRTSGGKSESSVLTVTAEPLLGAIRITEKGAAGTRETGHDGREVWSKAGTPAELDTALVETLLYDCAERLFTAQVEGFPIRIIGNRFRDDDGKSKDYRGRYFDIFRLFDRLNAGGKEIPRERTYFFDSATRLLDRVAYRTGGAPGVRVTTFLSGWQRFGNQVFASTITRQENGVETLRITVDSAIWTPAAKDNAFGK